MESRRADAAERLLASARELTLRAGGTSFTVAQVVSLSGTSLKTFYRCFSGKDELLVALFAGDARMGASALGELVDRHTEPIERLRSAVVGLFGFIARDGNLPYAAALVREHLRLAESRPEELRLVLRPLVEVFEREIAAAQACGAIREGDARRDAGILFQLVSAHLHAVIFHQIDGPPARVAEELWAFCEAALRPRSSLS
jgi:AcrR family transcriptional regulator